jgi:hypothetical protein
MGYSAYTKITSRFFLLAFGILGAAPDERPRKKQTSIGAAMSNIRKSDVKNHLSPRFSKKIFLSQSDISPDATAPPHKEPLGAGTEATDSTESALNLSSASGPKPVERSLGKEKLRGNTLSSSAERRSR